MIISYYERYAQKNIQRFRKTIDLYNLSVYNVKHSTIKMCERQTQNLSQPFTVCLIFLVKGADTCLLQKKWRNVYGSSERLSE